jgi:hypothetical protein
MLVGVSEVVTDRCICFQLRLTEPLILVNIRRKALKRRLRVQISPGASLHQIQQRCIESIIMMIDLVNAPGVARC